MSVELIEYRGHRLEVSNFGPGWRVFIYAPGSRLTEPRIPHTSDSNGRSAVIAEAKSIVDARLGINP